VIAFFVGVLVGIGVGQLAVLGVMALLRRPRPITDEEPPGWLCLPCYGRWQKERMEP